MSYTMETSKMDTSYLSQQVNTIINQLHGLFDEIGVSDHDRENREADVSLPAVKRAPHACRVVMANQLSLSSLPPCQTRLTASFGG